LILLNEGLGDVPNNKQAGYFFYTNIQPVFVCFTAQNSGLCAGNLIARCEVALEQIKVLGKKLAVVVLIYLWFEGVKPLALSNAVSPGYVIRFHLRCAFSESTQIAPIGQ